jgi:hypothetical protein
VYGESSVVGGVVENSGFVSHFDRVPLSPPKKKVKLAIANENSDPLFCSCRDIEHGNMVCCDNENCTYSWFHFQCVGLTRTPKGRWYCPECKCLLQFKSRKTLPKKNV